MTSGEVPSEDELLATGEKLNTYLESLQETDEDRTTITYGKLLAERIGDGVVPMGYVMATTLLSYDLRTGVDGFTGEAMPSQLTGLPPMMHGVLEVTALRRFAPEAFGEEFATEVAKVTDEIQGRMQQGE
jgi:hypothetical protein